MNCEANIVICKQDDIIIYPKNIDKFVLRCFVNALPDDKECDYLCIKRINSMVHYAYFVNIADTECDKIGIMISLNLVVIDDILALNIFMRQVFRDIADKHYIAFFDDKTARYRSTLQQPSTDDFTGARTSLTDRFNKRFGELGSHLGPDNYSGRPENDIYTIQPDGTIVSYPSNGYISQKTASTIHSKIESGNTLIFLSKDNSALRIASYFKIPIIEEPIIEPVPMPSTPNSGASDGNDPNPNTSYLWIYIVVIGLVSLFLLILYACQFISK